MSDLNTETAENRRLEEAHDLAMEKVSEYWMRQHGTDGSVPPGIYIECSNGDEILSEEAQDVFNLHYDSFLNREAH